MADDYQPETLALRAGTHRSQFNEHSEALYLTSSFVFENAAQAAARFAGDEPYHKHWGGSDGEFFMTTFCRRR